MDTDTVFSIRCYIVLYYIVSTRTKKMGCTDPHRFNVCWYTGWSAWYRLSPERHIKSAWKSYLDVGGVRLSYTRTTCFCRNITAGIVCNYRGSGRTGRDIKCTGPGYIPCSYFKG